MCGARYRVREALTLGIRGYSLGGGVEIEKPIGQRTEHIYPKKGERDKEGIRIKLMQSEAGVLSCSLIGISVGFFSRIKFEGKEI